MVHERQNPPITDFLKSRDESGLEFVKQYCEYLKSTLDDSALNDANVQSYGIKSKAESGYVTNRHERKVESKLFIIRPGVESETESEEILDADEPLDRAFDQSGEVANGSSDARLKLLRTEIATWVLLFRLCHVRQCLGVAPEVTQKKDIVSDAAALLDAHVTDLKLNELRVVKEWLEDAASDDFEPAVGVSAFYYPSTFEELRTGDTGAHRDTVTRIDPDAALVQNKRFSSADSLSFENLLNNVYSCVRTGQVSAAIERAVAAQHHWLASCVSAAFSDHLEARAVASQILNAGEMGEESLLPSSGPASQRGLCRILFNAMCYATASERRLCTSERAVFGVLCADVASSSLLCRTWEDYVWTHYHAYYHRRAELLVTKLRKPNNQEADPFDRVALPLVPEPVLSSPALLFAGLLGHESQEVAQSAKTPFALLQAAIAQDQLPRLLEDVAAELFAADGVQSSSIASDGVSVADNAAFNRRNAFASFSLPYYTRLLAHLVLFVQRNQPKRLNDSAASLLLQKHLSQWLEENDNLDENGYRYVALLCSRIPQKIAGVENYARFIVQCLSSFLSLEDGADGVDGATIRWNEVSGTISKLVSAGAEYDLAESQVMHRASEISILGSGRDDGSAGVTPVDWRRICGVFVLSKFPDRLLTQTLSLANEYLLAERLEAFSALMAVVSDLLPEKVTVPMSSELRLVQHYRELAHVYDLYALWLRVNKAKPSRELELATDRLLKTVKQTLENRWIESLVLVDGKLESDQPVDSLCKIRNKYVYWLVELYFKILNDTCKFYEGNCALIRQMTQFVADERFKLYVCINAESKMAQFLQLVSLVFTNYLENSPSQLLVQ